MGKAINQSCSEQFESCPLPSKVGTTVSTELDLQRKLLHVMVIRHVAIDRFSNDLRTLFTKFLAPFGVELFLGFEELGLFESVLLCSHHLQR